MLFKVYGRFVPNLTRQDGSAFERLLVQSGTVTAVPTAPLLPVPDTPPTAAAAATASPVASDIADAANATEFKESCHV
jgi:hypothetical protein